jgi:hypothetical protein
LVLLLRLLVLVRLLAVLLLVVVVVVRVVVVRVTSGKWFCGAVVVADLLRWLARGGRG